MGACSVHAIYIRRKERNLIMNTPTSSKDVPQIAASQPVVRSQVPVANVRPGPILSGRPGPAAGEFRVPINAQSIPYRQHNIPRVVVTPRR